MDRLSSCYFCGAALDESLSEYPVVPEQLQQRADEQQTVVLCPTCRRKLATVVETVVSAAQSDGRAMSTGATAEPADDVADFDESGMDAQPDPMALSDANETVAEDYPDPDILDRATAESEGADASVDDAVADEQGEETDESSTEEAERERERVSEKAEESGREPEESQPALTRLEYSKVMRLLQNRAFPVDRSEIRDVAVNAYDIDPEQFDTITDLAVERDLIDEKNGQFVSPE